MNKNYRWLRTFLAVVLLLLCMPVKASAQEIMDTPAEYCGYQQPTLISVGELEKVPVYRARYSAAASEYWDKFGSDYFYQQMNRSERAFYDGLYTTAMGFLNGTQDAEMSIVSGGTYHHLPYVYSDSLGVQQAKVIASIFQMSNPQFYFINDVMLWGYDSGGIQFSLGVYDDFAEGIARSRYTSQFKSRVDNWLAQVNAQSDPVSKERKAHDLVLEKTSYDNFGRYHQSSAGVFLEGKAVCAGYAEAFALLCNGVGIETISVTSIAHEWNKVNLYGHWYGVDCTWDDTGAGKYEYFNVTDAFLEGVDTDHRLEDIWEKYQVPVCVNSTVITRGGYLYKGIDYSDVFDEYSYVDRNPDLKAAFGSDWRAALNHFVTYGMSEGRQANSTFDVQAYRAKYPDLRRVFGNDLRAYYHHYINYGKREGREATGSHTLVSAVTVYHGKDYASVYDYSYYTANNPDVNRAFSGDEDAVLAHFVKYGMKEGRRGNASFDVNSYRMRYKDLRMAYGADISAYYGHYMDYGRAEGRIATGVVERMDGITIYNGVDYAAVYDFDYYINRYPDLKAAFGNDDLAALVHFAGYGMAEGRQASEQFNPAAYRGRYRDLDATFGDGWKEYYSHYMDYGMKEGRNAK